MHSASWTCLTGVIYARRSVTACLDLSILVPWSRSQRIRQRVGPDILVIFSCNPMKRQMY